MLTKGYEIRTLIYQVSKILGTRIESDKTIPFPENKS